MRQPRFGAGGGSQRRLGDRQQRRRRPAFALCRREAHAHVLILALLDEQLEAAAFRRGLFEQRLQFVLGHRRDAMLSPLQCPSSTISRAATTPTSRSSSRGWSARPAWASSIATSRRACPSRCLRIETAPGISILRSTHPPTAPPPCPRPR